jgi:hypothetical protein
MAGEKKAFICTTTLHHLLHAPLPVLQQMLQHQQCTCHRRSSRDTIDSRPQDLPVPFAPEMPGQATCLGSGVGQVPTSFYLIHLSDRVCLHPFDIYPPDCLARSWGAQGSFSRSNSVTLLIQVSAARPLGLAVPLPAHTSHRYQQTTAECGTEV